MHYRNLDDDSGDYCALCLLPWPCPAALGTPSHIHAEEL